MGNFFSKLGRSGNGYFEERPFRLSELKDPDTVFIDLRTQEDFLKSHLRTAIHLPLPEAGANKTQLEKIFNKSGLQELLVHYHVREDPLCLVLYASQPSYFMQDIPRLLHYHKEFFSSFSHQLYILSDGFANIKTDSEICFSSDTFRKTLPVEDVQQSATSISENLFLGAMSDAESAEFIQQENIEVLVNVSREMYDPPANVKYVQIAIEDQNEIRFLELLQTICDILRTIGLAIVIHQMFN